MQQHHTLQLYHDPMSSVNLDCCGLFIRKEGLTTEEQGEEIIHLRAKAKDVFQVGLKSSGVDIRTNPDSLHWYSLLRKHFSYQQFLLLPLQDFYTTLPDPQEDSYGYWSSLCHAADVTAEFPKEQNKQQDNLSIEVTGMFIRSCTNSYLVLTFHSKTTDKWWTYEVQEVLNVYHSEKFIKAVGRGREKTVQEKEVAVNRIEINSSPASLCDIQSSPQSKATEHSTLERVIDVLEKVLMNNIQSRQVNRKMSRLQFRILSL